ncbi:penicillin acylase family protein [Membranihabitans marinus]
MNPFTGFWTLADPIDASLPDLLIPSKNIDNNIRVYLDDRMVPHIYTQTEADAFFALGYLHGKNRLFQMDLTQRAITGELSAILGPVALEKDIFARRINFKKAITNKIESWKNHPDMMILLNAYTSGVNEWISSMSKKDWPLEYKLLNCKPSEWTVEKTAAISISLAATLNLNLRDFGHTEALNQLGDSLFNDLFPLTPEFYRPIISQNWPKPQSDLDRFIQHSQSTTPTTVDIPIHDHHVGSNNWAVNADLTENGLPILANDPHLPLNLPSIWYEVEIKTPQMHSHGVSIPGMAGIIIGFNKHVAWGLTNTSIDVLDSYSINWVNKDTHSYLLDNDTLSASVRREIIEVKNEENHIEEILETYWGPILYDDSAGIRQNVAVRWVSHMVDKHCDFRTFYELMKAQNLNDYQQAIQNFYIPGQNIIFADHNDSIGITIQGKFPIKHPNRDRFIQDGSNKENDWSGFIPDSLLPRQINPPEGYLISANEWPTDRDYPFPYSGHFDQYRGRTIEQLLLKNQPLNLEKMADIQNSVYNMKAAECIPLLVREVTAAGMSHPLLDSLARWNFEYSAFSSLPTLCEIWLDELSIAVFDEISQSPISATPQIWRLRELIQSTPNHAIFDIINTKDKKENASENITMSWQRALEKFETIEDVDRKWGKREGLSIKHLLQIPSFSHQQLMTGGNGNTISAITKTNGPSWKMIVELSPHKTRAKVIYPGGQSGNPGSPYYDNFIQPWLSNDYYDIELIDDDISPSRVLQTIEFQLP